MHVLYLYFQNAIQDAARPEATMDQPQSANYFLTENYYYEGGDVAEHV